MRDLINMAKTLYEADEHQWMLDQIEMLEGKKYESIDHGNLLLFLSEMAASDRLQLRNRFTILLIHMLKFNLQPEMASQSWVNTVLEQQRKLEALLDEKPSLKHYSPSLFLKAYPSAVKAASRETKIPIAQFPSVCPWTIDEVLVYDPVL